MADVTLSAIRKSFGALDVIKGVDLDLKSENSSFSSAPPAAENRRSCA